MVPREFTFEPKKIDLGIVIGGSVGGLAFLIIVGIVLWKVSFWGVMIHTDLIYQSIKVGNTKLHRKLYFIPHLKKILLTI